MAKNLKSKAVSGAAWTGVQKFVNMLLGFISGIVLARLLTPDDYGVVGMLAIFLAISQTFVDGGFGSALIQKKRPTDVDYSTILYWNVSFAIFLYVVLYFCAPFISGFYHLPVLTEVLRIQGLVLIINAARIVQHNQLRKRLELKKVAIINITSYIIALGTTIYLAWRGWGVWALVTQQLLLSILCTILYWMVSKWRPLFAFSVKSFKELFSFGGFVLLSNLVTTLCNNIQGLLIGRVYNPATLGFYTKAHRTEGYASTFISSVLDQVSYPVLSEAQNDKQRMINIIRQFIGVSAFVTFPLVALLVMFAKPIFLVLYSERWLESVPYFQLLCIGGISICLQNINYYAVAAIGKSKLLFKWTFIKRIVGLILVVGGLALWGIYGLIVGTVVTSWLIYLVNARLASKHIGYRGKRQFYDLFPSMALSVVAAVISVQVSSFCGLTHTMELILRFLLFIACYFAGAIFLKVEALSSTREVAAILLDKYKTKKR